MKDHSPHLVNSVDITDAGAGVPTRRTPATLMSTGLTQAARAVVMDNNLDVEGVTMGPAGTAPSPRLNRFRTAAGGASRRASGAGLVASL